MHAVKMDTQVYYYILTWTGLIRLIYFRGPFVARGLRLGHTWLGITKMSGILERNINLLLAIATSINADTFDSPVFVFLHFTFDLQVTKIKMCFNSKYFERNSF